MTGFCSDPLWDNQISWNTTNPDVTECFRHTVGSVLPILFLILLSPFDLFYKKKRIIGPIPWNILCISRFSLTSFLIVITIIELIYSNVESYGFLTKSFTFGSSFRLIGYALSMIVLYINKCNSKLSSGVMFTFWLIHVILEAIAYRSVFGLSSMPMDTALFIIFSFRLPLVVIQFFLCFLADIPSKYRPVGDNVEVNPMDFASFPSKLVFAWIDPFIFMSWRKTLKFDDLTNISEEHLCKGILPTWQKHWANEEEQKKSGNISQLSVVRPIIYSYWDILLKSAICQFLFSNIKFISPLLINELIAFVSSKEPSWKGFLWTGLLFLTTFVCTILNSQTFYYSYEAGLKLRTSLTTALYNKAIKLSNASRKQTSVGETTNLMAIDSQKVMDFLLYINMMWSSPYQIILCVYFLWQILGVASLAGLLVMVLMVPFNIVVGNRIKQYTGVQMKIKDERIKMMNEILSGIKVLKLYAWENSFAHKIMNFRVDEISNLRKTAILNAINILMWSTAPFLVALASFGTFLLTDKNNVLDAQTAFVSLSLFNLLRIPLNILPMIIVYGLQCKVSIERITKFLNSEELDTEAIGHNPEDSLSINVKNANFTWNKNQSPFLKDINVSIKPGSLVAIVGQVGSGKSSLLSALLGEMEIVSGSANIRGKIAYAPQLAWLQNSTIRQNITFGRKYNKKIYSKVINASALEPDLEILPAGDKTEIGEKGVNLSGGQKQRVSVARCTYSNADLYLLDDPLSAVDSHVGKHIFNHVISTENGLLKDKTRLVVTHGARFLPRMDHIIVMKDGYISQSGSYRQLLNDENGEFSKLLIQYLNTESDKSESEPELEEIRKDLESKLGNQKLMKIRSCLSSITDASSNNESIKNYTHLLNKGKLIEDEEVAVGQVNPKIYINFFKYFGPYFFIITILSYISNQGFAIGTNLWLAKWSTDELATRVSVRDSYLAVYGALGLCQGLFVVIASITLALGSLKAAKTIHSELLVRVLRAPMQFFDTTPLGRVLNRFSKDVETMDTTIPNNFRMLMTQLLNVIGTFIVICFALPIFIITIIPMCLAYYGMQKIYIHASRQVKRFESTTRSPIYSHFTETLHGISTIKAFNLDQSFSEENEKKCDVNAKCYFLTFTINRWLSIRLELIGNLIILFVSIFSVLSRGSIDPGLVGLSLSYSLTITLSLNMLVRNASDIENNMISMERIQEYSCIKQEAPYNLPDSDPPENWPQYGVIKFDNFSTRYREGMDLVLKNINFTIERGEKVGIVGRTGAGKSSLTLSLFRIIEPESGSIYIDNENIRFLGLGKLRSRITIIPQDPVLFTGSLRMNLDPTQMYSDKDIWTALDHAHLKTYASRLYNGLHFRVSEGGGNISVGQRQLICLARALLRKTQVLILDEATAAIDLETDDLIQEVIRKEFKECTVITIAHRLNTIMDSNRIIVLESGRIVESDSPEALLSDIDSVFYSMVTESSTTELKNS